MAYQLTGVVQETKDNKRLKIDGKWYGSFDAFKSHVSVGDEVSFSWNMDKTGKYNNIVKDSVQVRERSSSSDGASAPSASGGGVAGQIMRQNALAHATALVIATGVSDVWEAQDLVMRLAVVFSNFSATGEFPEEVIIPHESGF